MVGLRDDAAIIPAGSPALEGVTSPFYPTRCQEKGSKRPFNTLAAPAKYEAECTTSETHRWGARDGP